jgi:hypothetical protein
MNEEYEELERMGDEELPAPELKPLPDGLRYDFLDDLNKHPIIISTDLLEEEIIKLVAVLRKHPTTFGYSLDDLKGINPTIATHRIFLKDGAEPVADFQRRLKSQMKQDVRKDVIRLLDARIIYPVKESDWTR